MDCNISLDYLFYLCNTVSAYGYLKTKWLIYKFAFGKAIPNNLQKFGAFYLKFLVRFRWPSITA